MRFRPTPPAFELNRKTTKADMSRAIAMHEEHIQRDACVALLNSFTYSWRFAGGVFL
jgi:hypothetical protein